MAYILQFLKRVACPESIPKFHTTGVNQKNNCINIFNNCEKSGTSVVIADVNLVTAIINAYVAINIYIAINILGLNPKATQIIDAITNKTMKQNCLLLLI